MSTILAYTSPALGHLFPMTPLLLELRSRGHRVHVRTLAGQVPQMRPLGLEASAMDPRVEAIVNTDWRAGNARAALAGAVATFVAAWCATTAPTSTGRRGARARPAPRRHQLLGCAGGGGGLGPAVRDLQPLHAAAPVRRAPRRSVRVSGPGPASWGGSATACCVRW